MKILLTTTSFQDTPGKHHQQLNATGFDIDKIRGPVKKEVLLPIIDKYDGVICGDDDFSREVISKGVKGKLKVISKYGVGLDKIDLDAAKEFNLTVYNTPGVNHITVAEHAISMMLTYLKNIHHEYNYTKNGKWKRLIGSELYGKKVGILGLGKIGKELAKRLYAFGVDLYAYDISFDEEFVNIYEINKKDTVHELINEIDILTLHLPLNENTSSIINKRVLDSAKDTLIIMNTSRALLIEQMALRDALSNRTIKAYLTDVMDEEPMPENHFLIEYDNVMITPHIGSRTYESVERQGLMAVENLFKKLIK